MFGCFQTIRETGRSRECAGDDSIQAHIHTVRDRKFRPEGGAALCKKQRFVCLLPIPSPFLLITYSVFISYHGHVQLRLQQVRSQKSVRLDVERVVKIEGTTKGSDDLYVRGTYDGYGRVEIRRSAGPAAGGSATTVATARPWQFRYLFDDRVPEDDLLCSKIYCDGDGGDVNMDDPSSGDIGKLAKMQMKTLGAFLGESEFGDDEEEEEPRHCVPGDITVLDELSDSMLTGIRKLNTIMRSRANKEKKRKKLEEGDDKENRKRPAKEEGEGKAAPNNESGASVNDSLLETKKHLNG